MSKLNKEDWDSTEGDFFGRLSTVRSAAWCWSEESWQAFVYIFISQDVTEALSSRDVCCKSLLPHSKLLNQWSSRQVLKLPICVETLRCQQVTSHYSTQTVAKTLAYRTLSSWRYVLYPLYGLWINSNSDGKKTLQYIRNIRLCMLGLI